MKAFLEVKKELSEGMFLTVKVSNGEAIVFDQGLKVGELLKTEKELCKVPNRQLKARVLEKKLDLCPPDGFVYEVEVLRFADLHMHSSYSLLDGMSKIEGIVQKVEYAAAITEHGTMYGLVEKYKKMLEFNKFPIVGFEAYVSDAEGGLTANHLILIAKNEIGFKNVVKLTSEAYETFYRKPQVTYENLKRYSQGLIVLSGCLAGEIPRALQAGNFEKAKSVALKFQSIFGEDFYLEIQRHGLKEEEVVNPGLIKLSKELGVKLVATVDSHYVNKEDAYAHEVLLCIQTGTTMENGGRLKLEGSDYHIHTPEEMEYKFSDLIEAVDNTLEIAEKCQDFCLELGKVYMPKYEVPDGFSSLPAYLEYLAEKGFEERFGYQSAKVSDEYTKRLKYELEVILSMGYADYFIIVWDLINYARKQGIGVGPGRGSAVGCLVSYCLKITDVDPVKYHLYFERFLNPERISLPDIDIDFEDARRQEIIDYATRKYGEESVARIITFGTMASRMVVRDCARALGYQPWMGDKVAKLIPSGLSIAEAVRKSPELKKAIDDNSEIREIIEISEALEGNQRHASTHACGILIAPGPVKNYLPTQLLMDEKTKQKVLTSQMNMVEAEELGLIKMDVLGLRTLGVLLGMTRITGEEQEEIDKNNPYIYAEISKGKTYGVFQLESHGMRQFMMDLFDDVSEKIAKIEQKYGLTGYRNPKGQTENKSSYLHEMNDFGAELFERLIAGISLYRPGPLDYIPNYLEGKKNPESIVYLTPELEPILKDTYGCIIYQEQVMSIVQKLAGYTLGRADLIRRAMGKKKMDVMEKEKKNFIYGLQEANENIDGCIKRGIPKEIAEVIWDQMVDFAKYAFNRSHAAAYACIAARCAYYKHYYPVEFMCEVLNSVIDNVDKLKGYLNAASKLKIKILPPSVQHSTALFKVVENQIAYGFKGLKHINKHATIVEENRKKQGPFKNLSDFIDRISKLKKADKGFYEALIFTGALDCFEGNKAQKLDLAMRIVSSEKSSSKTIHENQVGLFDFATSLEQDELVNYQLKDLKEYESRFLHEKEKEFAGLYVTGHPVEKYASIFESHGAIKCDEVEPSRRTVVVGAAIKGWNKIYTRTNKIMYGFEIEDETGSIKCVIFPKEAELLKEQYCDQDIVILKGQVEENDFGTQLIVQTIQKIGDFETLKQPTLVVMTTDDMEDVKMLDAYAQKEPGEVIIGYIYQGQKYKGKYKIRCDFSIQKELRQKFPDKIAFKFNL